MPTKLLIDGYNLLFASSVFASTTGPPTLKRTRAAFLEFLAQSLDDKLRRRTTIAFDATQAPPGLSHDVHVAGMHILFSRRGKEADELIEELLEAEQAPRELLVVSSDHRVQRAARQRGAQYIDSDDWIRQLELASRAAQTRSHDVKESSPPSDELKKWLEEFSDVDPRQLAPSEPVNSAPLPSPETRKKAKRKREPQIPDKDDKPLPGIRNPFPPGYAEDLFDDPS